MKSMNIRNTINMFLMLFAFLNINSAQAVTGIVPDAQAVGIDCSGVYYQCFGPLSASSKVFNLVVAKCTSTNSTGCAASTYQTGYSNSNDSLIAGYIAGANATEGNISLERYKPVQNCIVINDGGANQDTKSVMSI